MASFSIPLNFETLTHASAANPITPSPDPPRALLEALENDPSSLLSPPPNRLFTALYTLISKYQSLAQPQRASLLALLESLPSHVTTVTQSKIALYFLAGCLSAGGGCKVFEKSGRHSLLEIVHTLLLRAKELPAIGEPDREQIASQTIRLALHTLEHPSIVKDKLSRPVLSRCISTALELHPSQALPATTAFLHALNRHEHLSVPLSEVLSVVYSQNEQCATFVTQFIHEIACLSGEHLSNDPLAAKSIASFLSNLSEIHPQILRSNLAMLLEQLNIDAYLLRNGILHTIASLILDNPQQDDPLLDILLHRARADVHAFARSKAIHLWLRLLDQSVVPHRMFPVLAKLGADKLHDKAAIVRKSATILLARLLVTNPFGPSLERAHYEMKLRELGPPEDHSDGEGEGEGEPGNDNETSVGEGEEVVADADEHEAIAEGVAGADEDEPSAEDADAAPQIDVGEMQPHVEEESDAQQPEQPVSEEDAQLILRKRYYSTAVSFIHAIQKALDAVYPMLRSKSVTDVSEAVSLLVTAIQFKLETVTEKAVRKILPLALAKEVNIRQAVVRAYVRLLAPDGVENISEKGQAMAVAKRLTGLGMQATTGELASLEALISAFCGKQSEYQVISPAVIAILWDLFAGRVPGASDEQRRAALIIVGMIATEKPDSLQTRIELIASIGLDNQLFARWSCVALCKIPPQGGTDTALSHRLSELVKATTDLCTVEQAINAIFNVSEQPEHIVQGIIRDLEKRLYASPANMDAPNMSRFFLVIGHVAIKELVRIESLVNQIRRDLANQGRKDGSNEEDEQSAAEVDMALELAEKELVSPTSLLGRYGNLARKFAVDREAPAELQTCAVLCMAKLMCAQEAFCKNNLRLLFSILSSSPEPLVRSNSVTALGDIAFRFPNLVEPWSSNIYAALKDTDVKVRKNTLMALTHLILNDMVKVKGQIVGLAICILDSHERIAELAKLFFYELARKSKNAIYNILPDTISCMSKMDDLTSKDFRAVVSFLIGLMDKESHSDGMVEKLCHRFRSSESERETRDLAYCISLLNMSERGIKKLSDNFKCYSALIVDELVYSSITQVIAKYNKPGISQTSSQMIEELNKKIEVTRNCGNEYDTNLHLASNLATQVQN